MRWTNMIVALWGSSALAQAVGLPSQPSVPPAQATNQVQFGVSNRVTAAAPSCSVLVQTQWDPNQFMFGGALFDAIAGRDAGGFSDPEVLLNFGGNQEGDVSPDGDAVTDIVSEHLYCGPCCDFFPCFNNPEPLWTARWSTDDFTPRVIHLSTVTYKYDLYIDKERSQSFLDQLQEASADITITCPADCDQSSGLGVLDLFDFLCYLNEFNAGSPDADCDGDGVLTLFDFLCFVNEFNAGC